MSLGERIAIERTKIGLTQRQLAVKLDISTGAIANYELGRTEPKATVIKNLAEIFDVSCDYLLGKDKKISMPETLSEVLTLLLHLEKNGFDLRAIPCTQELLGGKEESIDLVCLITDSAPLSLSVFQLYGAKLLPDGFNPERFYQLELKEALKYLEPLDLPEGLDGDVAELIFTELHGKKFSIPDDLAKKFGNSEKE